MKKRIKSNETNTRNYKFLKPRKLTIIALLCLALIVVGVDAASAADGDLIYVNGSGGSDDNNGTSWTWAKKSIKNAIGTVNTNGTVNIADGIYTGSDNKGITINKNVNITGQSQDGTVIDAQNSGRIFTISSGANVTIQNLTLTNGNTDGDGGAIYNTEGSLNVSGCTFTNNKADHGGAIYKNGPGFVTVSGSTFKDNTATYSGYGGAIYITGFVMVSGSTFTNNKADYGSAIYHNGGSVTVGGSTFTDNKAGEDGGAISNVYGSLNVVDSIFNGNSANRGGALSNGGSVTVSGSTFNGNHARYSDTGYGGAIHNTGTLTVNGTSTFSGNTASSGGAIYNDGNLTVSGSTFTDNKADYGGAISNVHGSVMVSGSTFTGSTAPSFNADYGGAIYNDGTLIVSGSTFTGNIASKNGGAIYNTGGSVTLYDSTFKDNTAIISAGGAISNYGGKLNVVDSIFNGNSATDGSGGAIYSTGILSVSGSTFTGNTASSGGAIYNDGGSVTVSDSTFSGNTATKDGGAIYSTGSLSVSGSTFTDNKADYGGAIYNTGSSVTVSGSIFTNNTANGDGGAITNEGTIAVINSTFKDNIANRGGAIRNTGTVNVVDSTFSGNNAGTGGAIYNTGSSVTASGSTFTNNKATGTKYQGGAIYTFISKLVINDCTFNGNSAGDGGTIYTELGSSTVHYSRFIGNKKYVISSWFGSVDANDNWWGSDSDPKSWVDGFVKVDSWLHSDPGPHLMFVNNESGNDDNDGSDPYHPKKTVKNAVTHVAVDGKVYIANGIYTGDDNQNITINKNMTVTGQSGTVIDAGGSGQIFTVNSGVKVTVQNLTLANGYAIYGGAIHNNGGALNIVDSIFTGNSASNSGGALSNAGTVTVSGCTFTGNRATYGGALYNTGSGFLDVVDSVFSGNSASYGGAISNTGDSLVVDGSTFTGNSGGVGGAVYTYDGSNTLHFNRIIGNTNYDIYSLHGSVDAAYNWWGSNENPSSRVSSGVTVGPWMILNITADPASVQVGGTSTVTVDLLHDSSGVYHDPRSGHVPDGLPVKFTATNGIVNPESSTLANGSVKSVFTADAAGTGNVTATVDDQKVSVSISTLNVDKTPTTVTVANTTGVNGQTVDLTATLTDGNGNSLSGRTVIFNVNDLEYTAVTGSDGKATVTYKITENAGNYNVTVTFAGDDEYMDSEDSGILHVDPSASLYLKPITSNANPKIGDTFVITYKLGNYGPDAAENVTVTFRIPEGLEFVNVHVDSGVWIYDSATGIVTWTLDSVPVGDPYLYLTVKALNSGSYSITPKITSDTYNWNSGDDGTMVNNVQSGDGSGSTVKAAGKTVPMQETGLPFNYLLLAVLVITGSFLVPKRK